VLEPSVLVADEPTSMLDAPLQHDILTLLYELIDNRDIALLHITHDIAQASAFADRIAVLHDGRIVEEAPPTTILQQPRHEQTQRLVDAAVTVSGDGQVDSKEPRQSSVSNQ
jgi:ABC-type dipeptide/oligopeptide/nickel transport system ATPase component